MDAEGEEVLWSEEGGGQDVEMLNTTWQGPQAGGALPVRKPNIWSYCLG